MMTSTGRRCHITGPIRWMRPVWIEIHKSLRLKVRKGIKRSAMNKLILYHGSACCEVTPTFGLGNDRHDYGKGFYLTDNKDLAKEWAVCKPCNADGWVHKYELDVADLKILDFEHKGALAWLAELMKHREASTSGRYRMLAPKFIEKYAVDSTGYDVIRGYRANASYFYIAKEFAADNVDVDILEDLLFLGGPCIQYCLKSPLAFSRLKEIKDGLECVPYDEFNAKYNLRDLKAREAMHELIESPHNKVGKVFSTLM